MGRKINIKINLKVTNNFSRIFSFRVLSYCTYVVVHPIIFSFSEYKKFSMYARVTYSFKDSQMRSNLFTEKAIETKRSFVTLKFDSRVYQI